MIWFLLLPIEAVLLTDGVTLQFQPNQTRHCPFVNQLTCTYQEKYFECDTTEEVKLFMTCQGKFPLIVDGSCVVECVRVRQTPLWIYLLLFVFLITLVAVMAVIMYEYRCCT
jgi:hypothetical protein